MYPCVNHNHSSKPNFDHFFHNETKEEREDIQVKFHYQRGVLANVLKIEVTFKGHQFPSQLQHFK